jgi:hypothetical protein
VIIGATHIPALAAETKSPVILAPRLVVFHFERSPKVRCIDSDIDVFSVPGFIVSVLADFVETGSTIAVGAVISFVSCSAEEAVEGPKEKCVSLMEDEGEAI